MTTRRLSFSVLLILVVSSRLALATSGEGGGYWSLQLSPNSVSTVPFQNWHISVWEHATDQGRYYSMPLVELLPETARILDSFLIGGHVMQFDVLMWTEEAREAVFQYLKGEGRTGEGGRGKILCKDLLALISIICI